MDNAYADKAAGEKEKVQAKIEELKAQLKVSAADAKIAIQKQIEELEARMGM